MPRSSELVLSTDREVRNARAIGSRSEYRIKGAANLVLRVTEAGGKSWTFLYASPTSGRRSKLSIGVYPAKQLKAARDEALALAVLVRSGIDPLVQRQAAESGETFNILAQRYLAEHERRNARDGQRSASTNEAERLLKRNVLPALGHHRAAAITRAQVAAAIEAVAARGSLVSADHVLGLVRAIYNWANGTGALETDPTRGLKKRNASKPRHRTLTDTEVRELWLSLDRAPKLSQAVRIALKLQLLLGLRIGEALGAERTEVNLQTATWTLPAERTKANREHSLPLPPLALSLLQHACELAGDGKWLFPSDHDGKPVRAKTAMRAILRMRDEAGLPGIGTHDLRRTVATGLGDLGVADEIIERILNHAPRTVAGRHYNHAKYREPIRQALWQWDARVTKLIIGATS